MGAMAIATLAGSRLELLAGTQPLLTALLPAITTATMLFWAAATWWIPLLLLLMIWRHTAGGVPLSYHFDHWSMVFPFGMYTAATWTWSHVNSFDFLFWIPHVFIWAAIAAWIACCAGLAGRGLGRYRSRGAARRARGGRENQPADSGELGDTPRPEITLLETRE